MKDNKKMINDDELENVSGGYLFNQSNIPGGGADIWEVIDDRTGKVLFRTKGKEVAMKACKGSGAETKVLTYSELSHLRQTGKLPGYFKK